MLSSLPPKTAIFIDYSNIFYAKYTVGWFLEIEKFLEECRSNPNIVFVGLYGAYDPRNLSQYNWSQLVINRFKDAKYLIYFKPLESHGSKNKWNVDTEMGYDLAAYKNVYNHIVLLSGDGDFAHPLKKLINDGKTVLISSTRWLISGLANLSQEFPMSCRFLDFNNDHAESVELRNIFKTPGKLAIDPCLQEFLKTASKTDIQDLLDFVETVKNKRYYTRKSASFFQILNKNWFPIYKNIARWQLEEQNLLINYLRTILI